MNDIPLFDGSLLVTRDAETLYRRERGPADADRPITPATRFQLASVSKQFTATAILLLVEANRLALTDRLTELVPGCPPSWTDITVHQLLSHTSGLGHWEDHPDIDLLLGGPDDPEQVVAAFQARDPLHTPGDRFHYSSPGYALLAHIVELVGGVSYRDYLADNIFGPVGMHDTFAGNGADRADLAVGHDADGGPTTSFELDAVGRGAGDVWSTADDLARWNRAVADGLILSRGSRAAAFTAHATMSVDPDIHYGYGWMLSVRGGLDLQWHTGDNAGFRSLNVWIPEERATVVALINTEKEFAEDAQAYAVLDTAISLIRTS